MVDEKITFAYAALELITVELIFNKKGYVTMIKPSRFLMSGMMMGALVGASACAMEMPDDALKNVFVNCSPRTLARVAPVSKQWLRVSEEDNLWQFHGLSSKKDCLSFPFPTLEKEHFVALFKWKYLAENGVFFWKLIEDLETPDEIIKSYVDANHDAAPCGWTARNTLWTKQDAHLMEVTTDVTCCAEMMNMYITSTKVPYVLTLKGSWDIEQPSHEEPYFPKLSTLRLKKLIEEKKGYDLLGRLYKVQENQDFQDIERHINTPHAPQPYIVKEGRGIRTLMPSPSIYWEIKLHPLDMTKENLPQDVWPIYRLILE